MKVLNVVNKIEKTIFWLINYFLWFAVVYCGLCGYAYGTFCENEWLEVCVIIGFGYYYLKKFVLKCFEIWRRS